MARPTSWVRAGIDGQSDNEYNKNTAFSSLLVSMTNDSTEPGSWCHLRMGAGRGYVDHGAASSYVVFSPRLSSRIVPITID